MHFLQVVFRWNFAAAMAVKEKGEIIHISGCICRFAFGFCKNKKERTETLYQSFSPFMSLLTLFEPPTKNQIYNRFLGRFLADFETLRFHGMGIFYFRIEIHVYVFMRIR